MLAADREVLAAYRVRETADLLEKEISYLQAELGTIATQAALLAGFVYGTLTMQGGTNSGKSYVATAQDMRTEGTRSAADASYGFTGEGTEEWAGFSSGPAGDVDLDGHADIMVGAFRFAKPSEMKIDAGKAYLFRMGLLSGPGTYSLGDAHASWIGEFEGDEAGYKASSPGDMNGDGLSDIIVSGWQLNIPSGAGKVWVLLNP